MKNKWKQILIFVFLIGSVIWAGKGIFKYNVFSTHDGNHHIARAFDVVQTIKEGHFPLRWAGSLNYNCGAPIYNFYYPLIYYLVTVIYFFTHNIIFTLKIIDFVSLLSGTLFFYLWIKDETKKQLPAIAGALTYLYAPYRFSLIFVRGSPEYLAYAILPAVLYFYSLCFNSKENKFIIYAFISSVLGAILTISHNFAAMFLMPIILLYLVIKVYIHKLNYKKIFWIIFSFLGAFGMGSFFIGPAILEQKFTRIGHSFLEWRDHFPTLWQLFKSKWGYFYSSPGTVNDGMSFMLGYAQWLILGIAAIFIVYKIVKNKFKFLKIIKGNVRIIYFFLASLFAIYLILPISIPLWEKVRLLQQVQFSWRLLGTAVFTTSALFSFMLAKINSKKLYIGLFIGVSLLTVFGTRNFMLPQPISVEDLYRYDDFEKLHPERYSSTTMGDEIIAPSAEGACWFDVPLIATEKEKVEYSVVDRGNTYGSVKFNLPQKPKGKILTTGLGYFPGIYKFEINGNATSYNDCSGRVCFSTSGLREGENFISWKVGQSPIENLFNYVTLGFFAVWLLILFIKLTGIYKDRNKLVFFVLTVFVFLLFIFFRSYNLPGRIGFGWDQERDAVAATGILAGKLTLLGPRVQGPAGFFLPPYFFYIIAPFYALGGLSPFATAGFIIFSAFLFFTSAYLIVSKVFDKKTALLFLAIWAVNPLSVSIDTIAWNPVVIPTLFLVFIYTYYRYLKNTKNLNIFLLGLIFGFGVSFHIQFIFTFLLLMPLLIDLIKKKNFLPFGYLITGIVIPFLPILIFDLRHNFLNVKQLIGYSLNSGLLENRTLVVWSNTTAFITGLAPAKITGFIFYVVVSLGLYFVTLKISDEVTKKIFTGLSLVWIFSLPLFYLFLKNPSEYYFNYLLLIPVLLVGYLLNIKKIPGVILLLLVVSSFILRSRPLLNNVALSLRDKNQAVETLGKITKNSSPFNISFDVPFNEDSGFRYLLKYHKIVYSGNPKDSLIEFIIPGQKRPNTFTSGQVGIYIPSEWLKNNWPAVPK